MNKHNSLHDMLLQAKHQMEVPIKVGDEILTGKFKNKRAIVKSFGVDAKNNQPTLITNKGTINLYNVRIPSLMPQKKI